MQTPAEEPAAVGVTRSSRTCACLPPPGSHVTLAGAPPMSTPDPLLSVLMDKGSQHALLRHLSTADALSLGERFPSPSFPLKT